MAKYVDAMEINDYLIKTVMDDANDPLKDREFNFGWRHGVLYAAFVLQNEPAADVGPRWIPVTEKLPEEEGQYLVSCDTDYGIEIARMYIDEDGERYFGCDWNDPDDIEAWMPLPNPYKRGEWKNE